MISFVCLSVCEHSSGHSFQDITWIFDPPIGEDKCWKPIVFGDDWFKVKVKVTKNIRNTFLAITSVLIKIETRNKNHFVPLKELYYM